MSQRILIVPKRSQLYGGQLSSDFLGKSFPRVRTAFYNGALFEASKMQQPFFWREIVGFWHNLTIVGAVIVILIYFVPTVVFKIFPQLDKNLVKAESLEEVSLLEQPVIKESEAQVRGVKPVYSLGLPEGKWVRIPEAEIEAEIFSNQNLQDKKAVTKILDKGIYEYPEFSTMGVKGKTVLLAGHHFNVWVSEEQSKKTFQNLNRVMLGDRVELISDYRQWNYEIYKIEQATQISEDQADLIMYTCVFWWNSDLRLFVYARLIEES